MKRHLPYLLAIGLSACGDGTDTPADAAPGADAPSPDAGADAPPGVKEGQVFIAEAHTPVEASIVFAMLFDGPLLEPIASADNCLTVADQPGSSLAAGSITVTGTATTVTLAQEQPGEVYRPSAITPADLFTAGDTLTVTSTGATVPAFSATVVAPADIGTVAFPASLSRSAPATMTWTAASADSLMILVTSTTTTPGAMLCQAPDTGTFTFSTAALALLPAALTEVQIVTYRVNETEAMAGAWKLFVRAADGVTSGAIAIGN